MALGVALSVHLMLGVLLASTPPKLPPGGSVTFSLGSLSLPASKRPLYEDTMVDNNVPPQVESPLPPPTMTEPKPAKPAEKAVSIPAKPLRKKTSRSKQSTASKKDKRKATEKARAKPDVKELSVSAVSTSEGQPTPTDDRQSSVSTLSGNQGVERLAQPLPDNPYPIYPRLARRRGQEGKVLIRVLVLGDGQVERATLARTSRYTLLDQAALKAVKRWVFQPALRAGKPVTATLTVPVIFRLKE